MKDNKRKSNLESIKPDFFHKLLLGGVMGKDGFDFNNPADSAWKIFEKTGDVSYYLLYKRLTED